MSPAVRKSFLARPLALVIAFGLAPLPLAVGAPSPWDCRAEGEDGEWVCRPRDWVPLAEVPPELQDAQCRQCGGRYIDPLADADRSASPEESDLHAAAGHTTVRDNTIYMTGGVEVVQGYRELRGNEATIERLERSATISGDVSLREPGLLLGGDFAEVDADTGDARLTQAQFLLYEQHMRGTAAELRRDRDGIIQVDDSELTYCAPGENDWAIAATRMDLDIVEGIGVARGAKVRVGGVPVFYMPYLRFPLDDRRRTGVLWPDIGSDSRSGIDVAVPVYFNLAPNYDAMYTPRFIEERGLNNELNLRYLDPFNGLWDLSGAYLSDDERYKDDLPEEPDHDRWFLQAKQDGLYAQRWRSRIDYSKASDVDYLKDLNTSSLDTQRQTSLLQLASLDYLGDKWLVQMDVQEYQSLADDIRNDYAKLPQITAKYRSSQDAFRFNPTLLTQYSYFDIGDTRRVTGQRVYAEAGANYPMFWQAGFLRGEVKYRHLNYDLSDSLVPTADDTPSAGAALANIDGGLFFERRTQIGGTALTQTLEPRIYYLYSEYEEQTAQPDFDSAELTFSYNQLFRQTRFSGRDRIDDANQLAVGVTTRFLDATSGQEYLSASIGQIAYFDDRRVRLRPIDQPLETSTSEVAAQLAFRPHERLRVLGNIVWDPHDDTINSANTQLNYRFDNGSLINLGYTLRRPEEFLVNQPVTEQTHLSAWLPLGDSNWRLFASWDYSLKANTSVEDMAGFEYDTCCWRVRILHLRYLDSKQGQIINPDDPNLERRNTTQVQILFKGLGGFGGRVSNILEDMIRGFRDSEY
jgi:LPS-assembly protein